MQSFIWCHIRKSGDKSNSIPLPSKEGNMSNCAKCRFRGIYDKNPKSLLGRMWKWHIGWCPGWKSYIKSLPDEEKERIIKIYSQ
jgi:hypothetical protein